MMAGDAPLHSNSIQSLLLGSTPAMVNGVLFEVPWGLSSSLLYLLLNSLMMYVMFPYYMAVSMGISFCGEADGDFNITDAI